MSGQGQKRSYNHVGSNVRFVRKRTSVTVPKVQSRDRSRSPNGFYGTSGRCLFRLDTGKLDHLAPLLSFGGNELSKVGGRTCEHRTSQVGEALLHVGIGESGIDPLVELLDNLRGRGFGYDDPIPTSRLIARQKF